VRTFANQTSVTLKLLLTKPAVSQAKELFFPVLSFVLGSIGVFFGFYWAALLVWLGIVHIVNAKASHFRFAKWIHWVHAMSLEPFAVLAIAVLRLIPVGQKPNKSQGRPILLVHGYANHGSVWMLHKKRLEAAGIGPVYLINLGDPFLSIQTYSERVREKVETITKETGREDIVLIGHSMGGLISAWYATRLAKPKSVSAIITVASPLEGTPVARYALGQNAREMEPRSKFLQELKAAMNECKELKVFHIATESDEVVVPGVSAANSFDYVLDDLGHAGLLYSKRVSEKIIEWLKEIDG
jgi:pimeloyl-ACP methyl ester carboxylesterase